MGLTKDGLGRTEEQFLREYDVTKYFRPSVTADAVLFRVLGGGEIELLLVKRGGHPYIGRYAFPGGFVEENESCEAAAERELTEETAVSGLSLYQLVTVSTPGRDPRWRCITVVYACEAAGEIHVRAGDDAAGAAWFVVKRSGNTLELSGDGTKFCCTLDIVRDAFGTIDLNRTKIVEPGLMAFDHAKIIMYLVEKICGRD